MARVAAIVVGANEEKFITANTVGEVKAAMNAKTYTATVNGEPADDSHELEENDFVSLAQSVKGA